MSPQTSPVTFSASCGPHARVNCGILALRLRGARPISRKNTRPRAELIDLLKQHRQALAASCASYDNGNEWEASRLATTVFTLVHDGGSIISLLTRLGLRSGLKFISTSYEINRKNLMADTPLIMVKITTGESAKYLPTLGDVPFSTGPIQFPMWWEKELVYRDGNFELTRRRLIFALRHQDGGGHVGDLTDESYVRLKTQAIWYSQVGENPPEPLSGAVAATMRQVAWEMTETLKAIPEDLI
jgi:hypothetical protein